MKQLRRKIYCHIDFLIYLSIVLAIFAVYSQVKHFGFTNFDDDAYVYLNPVIRKGITLEGLLWAFSFHDIGYFHPITWLSHMLDCELFGLNSGMHHLVNVVFHTANSLILFTVLRNMTGLRWSSCAVALLFSIHPVNVDTVAWISQRKNLLSLFFGLSAVFFYVRYVRYRRLIEYIITLFLFSVCLMAKPFLSTLPAIMILLDYWPLRRFGLLHEHNTSSINVRSKLVEAIAEKIPMFFLSALFIGIASYSTYKHGINISTNMVPMDFRIANASNAYLIYLQKIFWPVGLAVHHPFPNQIDIVRSVISAIAIVFITVMVVVNIRRFPYVFVGWFWFAISLLPASGIKMAGLWPSYAERWAYFPMIGIFIAMVWGLAGIKINLPVKRNVMIVLFISISILLMGKSWIQAGYWKSSLTLFNHAISVTDNNEEAHYRLADSLARRGRINEAVAHYEKAIKILPSFKEAHQDLGILLMTVRGDIKKAVDHLKIVVRLSPRSANSYNNLGVALFQLGKVQSAERHFRMALQLYPDHEEARNNLKKVVEIERDGARMPNGK
jgi:protein O-mannosyl-transferase